MIYLIEDCLVDAEAIKRTFTKSEVPDDIVHFQTGDAALDQLNDNISNSDDLQVQLPRLIILDLHLPGLDGREVLRRLKSSEDYKAIPVLVLSSSTSSAEVEAVYGNGANAFLRKPVGFENLSDMMHYTRQFWFDVAIMPKNFH